VISPPTGSRHLFSPPPVSVAPPNPSCAASSGPYYLGFVAEECVSTSSSTQLNSTLPRSSVPIFATPVSLVRSAPFSLDSMDLDLPINMEFDAVLPDLGSDVLFPVTSPASGHEGMLSRGFPEFWNYDTDSSIAPSRIRSSPEAFTWRRPEARSDQPHIPGRLSPSVSSLSLADQPGSSCGRPTGVVHPLDQVPGLCTPPHAGSFSPVTPRTSASGVAISRSAPYVEVRSDSQPPHTMSSISRPSITPSLSSSGGCPSRYASGVASGHGTSSNALPQEADDSLYDDIQRHLIDAFDQVSSFAPRLVMYGAPASDQDDADSNGGSP
jgi:hypothetical protein